MNGCLRRRSPKQRHDRASFAGTWGHKGRRNTGFTASFFKNPCHSVSVEVVYFFAPKSHFTQLPVSSLVQALSVFFAARTKKNKNVAKTSVSLGDGGLFNAFKKDGLYIRIDLQALVYGAFYF